MVEDNKIASNLLQFNFIELNSEFDNISKSDRIFDKYINYIIILPIVFIICVFIYLKTNKKSISQSEKNAEEAKKLAYNFLENAKNDITNTDLFYISFPSLNYQPI